MPGRHLAEQEARQQARQHRASVRAAFPLEDDLPDDRAGRSGGLRFGGRRRSEPGEVHRDPVQPEEEEGWGESTGDETFSECLRRLMRQSGLGVQQLSRLSWVDISYVSRLVNMRLDPLNERAGERMRYRQPSRDTILRLGIGMQLPVEDVDTLLLAAGYAPLVR